MADSTDAWRYTPEQVFNAIYGGETGYGKNSRTSPQGAMGPMQIMPATFRQWARPGESISNPDDNRAVAMRMITSYMQQYGGDPGRVATAYFSGPGNVAPGTSPTPFVKDVSDVNEPTSKYVANVMTRLGQPSRPVTPTPTQAPGPIDPSIIAHGGTSPPIPTTPGVTINSTPTGPTPSKPNIAGVTGPQLTDLAKNLKKTLGMPEDDGKDQGQQQQQPSQVSFPQPQAQNVSPLFHNPQLYAQRMAALNQPMQWGAAPPGQMFGAGFGPQNQPVYGTSLMSQFGRQFQTLNDPMWMNQTAGDGYG